jgi:phage repressor protein C with HTH and peptisase S24 domain
MAQLIEMVGGTGDAAEIADVSRDTINNWRKEGAAVPLQKALLLAQAAGVSLDWVATGHQVRPDLPTGLPAGNGDGFALIPRLEVQASAGYGVISEREDVRALVAFRRDWLRQRGINPQTAFLLTARGDSMEPTIRDGDSLLGDSSIDRIVDNGIYIFVYAGTVMLKRLHIGLGGAVTMISDNPLYPRETIPKDRLEDLQVRGRVMWFGRSI